MPSGFIPIILAMLLPIVARPVRAEPGQPVSRPGNRITTVDSILLHLTKNKPVSLPDGLEVALLEVFTKRLPPDRREILKATLRFRRGGKEWETRLMIPKGWIAEEGIESRLLEGNPYKETATVAFRLEDTTLVGKLASLPDQAFFDREDFGSRFRDALFAADEPFGCFLRGARVWDLGLHPEYPIYAICKTNNEDNKDFVPFRDAVLILSSRETGALTVLPMQEDAGKIPLPDREPPKPPIPGHPLAKTYSVQESWRAIPTAKLLHAHGPYLAFIHAGNFQSDAYRFEIRGSKDSPKTGSFDTLLRSDAAPSRPGDAVPGLRFGEPLSLPASAKDGVDFKVIGPSRGRGKGSYAIAGTFEFKGVWNPEWKRIPIHLLLSSPGDPEPLIRTIWIPRKHVHIGEDGYSGSFHLDLSGFFIMFPGQKPRIPPSAWIGFVHRDWRGPITRIDFKTR